MVAVAAANVVTTMKVVVVILLNESEVAAAEDGDSVGANVAWTGLDSGTGALSGCGTIGVVGFDTGADTGSSVGGVTGE